MRVEERHHGRGQISARYLRSDQVNNQVSYLLTLDIARPTSRELTTYAELARAGVGYHHAGLAFNDRKMTEKLFLDNKLQVICTTSTLAVGVS